jgi:hypothetical protein
MSTTTKILDFLENECVVLKENNNISPVDSLSTPDLAAEKNIKSSIDANESSVSDVSNAHNKSPELSSSFNSNPAAHVDSIESSIGSSSISVDNLESSSVSSNKFTPLKLGHQSVGVTNSVPCEELLLIRSASAESCKLDNYFVSFLIVYDCCKIFQITFRCARYC